MLGPLQEKDKVKVNMFFRGREMTHKELGRAILERLIVDVAKQGQPEMSPSMEGRVMFIMFIPGPSKT